MFSFDLQEAIDTNIYETHEVSKSKYGYLNHSQIDRIEHGATRYFSRQLSISRQEHHQYEEFSFSTAQNTPRHHRVTCNTIPGRASNWQPDYTRPGSHDFSFQPNYMAKTESSRAKARSQSEPKQRPERNVRSESKRKASLDGTTSFLANAQSQCSSPNSKPITNENQDPAFIRLYQKRSVVKDEDSDANSTITSRSSYCNSLLAYEVSYEDWQLGSFLHLIWNVWSSDIQIHLTAALCEHVLAIHHFGSLAPRMQSRTHDEQRLEASGEK